jgi:predicted dehydrogenase
MALTNKPTTVALIGCGAVSELLYTHALRALAGEGVTETSALVDPDPERTAKVGEYFPEAQRYRDLDELLTERPPELAIIAAPNRFHAEMAVACLERGAHVLCEKPMALTVAECDRMLRAAEAARRVLAVGHFRRFFPSTKLVKEVLRSRLLGPVQSFRCAWCHAYDWPGRSAFKFRRKESGGGVLMDHGTHMIDLLLWWLGDAAVLRYQDDAMGGVEANCRALLEAAGGARGTISLSHDWSFLGENRFVLECEKGWIAYVNDVVDRVQWGLRPPDPQLNATLASLDAGLKRGTPLPDCFAAQLRHVVRAARGGGPLQAAAEDARKGLALIEACYRGRTLLDMPWLDEAESRRAKELADALSA